MSITAKHLGMILEQEKFDIKGLALNAVVDGVRHPVLRIVPDFKAKCVDLMCDVRGDELEGEEEV
jgi:hypothetical protein